VEVINLPDKTGRWILHNSEIEILTIQTEDNLPFIPLEDVVGEDYYIHGKKEEEKE
jgi:hypothetical protein